MQLECEVEEIRMSAMLAGHQTEGLESELALHEDARKVKVRSPEARNKQVIHPIHAARNRDGAWETIPASRPTILAHHVTHVIAALLADNINVYQSYHTPCSCTLAVALPFHG